MTATLLLMALTASRHKLDWVSLSVLSVETNISHFSTETTVMNDLRWIEYSNWI